ncbi:MAG: glycosyltransferase family 4 protein, partial [Planctomycetota bacterium]|nr:glycosyltransferase family 4 protein [Planctomycetota bacterium]
AARPVRVLLLSRYGELGASSRMRSYQYLPALERAGIDVTVAPLLEDDYLIDRYGGRRGLRAAARGTVQRLRRLKARSGFDLLWVEKEIFPWLPAWGELRLSRGDTPMVVDYDDAVFHRYDASPSRLVRKLLAGKIDAVMRRARLVLVGSSYLEERARRAGAAWVERMPTVVDLSRYRVRTRSAADGPVTVGWIGTPRTAPYLEDVKLALATLVKRGAVRLRLIGAGPDALKDLPVERRRWNLEREAAEIRELDIGIMPVPDRPFERGKCGYKLIQYMASGLPVVASPVGGNLEVVSHGVDGYLAQSYPEWLHALEILVGDADLRTRMGAAGRRKVEQHYTLEGHADRLAGLLRAAAQGPPAVAVR